MVKVLVLSGLRGEHFGNTQVIQHKKNIKEEKDETTSTAYKRGWDNHGSVPFVAGSVHGRRNCSF